MKKKYYIDGMEFANWLVEKYGGKTGLQAAMVFEITSKLATMEKFIVEVKDDET